jgi:hypothetical protein
MKLIANKALLHVEEGSVTFQRAIWHYILEKVTNQFKQRYVCNRVGTTVTTPCTEIYPHLHNATTTVQLT